MFGFSHSLAQLLTFHGLGPEQVVLQPPDTLHIGVALDDFSTVLHNDTTVQLRVLGQHLGGLVVELAADVHKYDIVMSTAHIVVKRHHIHADVAFDEPHGSLKVLEGIGLLHEPGVDLKLRAMGLLECTAAVFQKSEKLTAPPASEVVKPQRKDEASILENAQSTAPIARPIGQQSQPVTDGQDQGQNLQAAACLQLINEETGLDIEDFTGEAAFADFGVDSLMSLALSAKICAELSVNVQASIFLECPTVQDLITWFSK